MEKKQIGGLDVRSLLHNVFRHFVCHKNIVWHNHVIEMFVLSAMFDYQFSAAYSVPLLSLSSPASMLLYVCVFMFMCEVACFLCHCSSILFRPHHNKGF